MILCWLAADGNAASNKVRCASKTAFEVATQSRPEPPAEDGGCFSFFFLVLFWIWPPDMGCHCARLIWFSFEVWGSAPTIGWANISLFVFSWFLEGIKVLLYVEDFCLWKQWTLCNAPTLWVMGRKSIIEAERDSINTSGPKPKQSQFRLLEAKYFPKTTGSYNETPYVKSKHLLNKWAEVRGRFRHSIIIFDRWRCSLFFSSAYCKFHL